MQASNRLNVFRILFLVKGILTLVLSLFFIGYGAFGAYFASVDEFSKNGNELPFNPGYFFVIIGIVGFVVCIVMGILQLLASKYMKQLKKYEFVFVIAILTCLTGILGMFLGAFTISLLQMPQIKELFDKK
ncbi:hypothetical protein [Ascidiimonas sp. W6]|uniref:hypothetical protein n=1 Tax=Ascidiimonas meishanensis TaxID=3128903 RepID=UPI0030EBF9FA